MSVISVRNGDTFTSSQDEIQFQIETFATEAYVDASISGLIDGAPGTLDTLNELAAALADDAAFSSTVVLKAGSTMTGLLNTVGVKNNAVGYNTVGSFIRDDTAGVFSRTALEVIRDLGSDGSLATKDERGAMFGFTIWNDATNTNSAPNQQQYIGGIQGKSGSNTNSNANPHWIEAFTYDQSFGENKLWDGTKDNFYIYPQTKISNLLEVEGTSGGVETSVVNIKTTNSGYDKGQITLEDSNAKAVTITGEDNTSLNKFRYIQTFDPDGDHNPSGGNTGDYGLYYYKDYSDLGTGVKMGWDVFGAQDGFDWKVRGDNNGGTNAYDYKAVTVYSGNVLFKTRSAYNTLTDTLEVTPTAIEAKVPVQFPSYTTTERNALTAVNGMQIYNSTTSKMQAYAGGSWVDLH